MLPNFFFAVFQKFSEKNLLFVLVNVKGAHLLTSYIWNGSGDKYIYIWSPNRKALSPAVHMYPWLKVLWTCYKACSWYVTALAGAVLTLRPWCDRWPADTPAVPAPIWTHLEWAGGREGRSQPWGGGIWWWLPDLIPGSGSGGTIWGCSIHCQQNNQRWAESLITGVGLSPGDAPSSPGRLQQLSPCCWMQW